VLAGPRRSISKSEVGIACGYVSGPIRFLTRAGASLLGAPQGEAPSGCTAAWRRSRPRMPRSAHGSTPGSTSSLDPRPRFRLHSESGCTALGRCGRP